MLKKFLGLVVVLVTGVGPAAAVTYTVGTCVGATHASFANAYNALGTINGPHTLRLCPGNYSSPSLSANYGHANLTMTSVSGSAGNTTLTATGAPLLTMSYQNLTVSNLTVNGSFTAATGQLRLQQTELTGNLTTNGNVILENSSVSGEVLGRNGVTATNSNLSGSITATNGAINLSGGTIDAVVGTDGNSQPINLSGVTMTGRSLQTAGNTITINNSTLGSSGSTVDVTAGNNVQINNSEVWGNVTANSGWNSLFLNPQTTVHGNCTPDPIGGGTCQDIAGSCSDLIGQATINEVHQQGNAERFIEVRVLNASIGTVDYGTWTLSFCSSRRSPCQSVSLSASSFDDSTYPWLVLTAGGIPHRNYIDFGQGGGNGMEVRLDDSQGRAIDYLSVDNYSDQLSSACPFQYDTTMGSTNSTTIMRLPDGTGDWALAGPGNSGDDTPGESNDGSDPGFGYDHLRLLHPPGGLTCSPSMITVQACANPECSELFANEATVSLTSPAGNWGANPVQFTGSTSIALQYTMATTITLNAAASEPAASAPTRCFSGGMETDCSMTISAAGFILDLPDHVAAESVVGTIAAVRADDSGQSCAPAFANQTRTIDLHSQFGNPGSGGANVLINGSAIATSAPGTATSLSFDGQGVAGFNLHYPDVGQVEIHAAFLGSGQEDGLVMTGVGHFIARPSHFELSISSNPAADVANGPVFRRAGETFTTTVGAFNALGQLAPNFGLETPPESVSLSNQLMAPSGGNEGLLTGNFGQFGQTCSGQAAAGTACGQFSWNEVGIIELFPALTSTRYLGTDNVSGLSSGPVGRFIPDHFTLSGGQLTNRAGLSGCNDNFSFFGERFDVGFTLLAQSVGGGLTENYTAGFARLGAGQLNLSGSAGGLVVDASSLAWNQGVGPVQAQLRRVRSAPDDPQDNYVISTAPIDSDGVGLATSGQVGSTRLVFGRIVIDNATGSELGPLSLPWRTEFWDGNTWRVESSDNCTAVDPGSELELVSGTAAGAGDQPISIGGGTTAINATNSVLRLQSGLGHFYLDAPGGTGWVDLMLGLGNRWTFLQDDLDDSGGFDNDPQARATFGLFDGNSQRILLREVSPR